MFAARHTRRWKHRMACDTGDAGATGVRQPGLMCDVWRSGAAPAGCHGSAVHTTCNKLPRLAAGPCTGVCCTDPGPTHPSPSPSPCGPAGPATRGTCTGQRPQKAQVRMRCMVIGQQGASLTLALHFQAGTGRSKQSARNQALNQLCSGLPVLQPSTLGRAGHTRGTCTCHRPSQAHMH